jgi:hypothetical protein
MHLIVTCRPISNYPAKETRVRVESPFHRKVTQASGYRATRRVLLSDGLDLLDREVKHLGCTRLVIEADFREDQIRQDGWPKATANPSTPRVVISLLDSKHGPLRYPCDRFTRFEDNVLAVARALEALRLVDRYGVTQRGEQYAGWKALPSSTAPTMTTDAAATLLASVAGVPYVEVMGSKVGYQSALRSALMKAHPDRGGNEALFHDVQTARRTLDAIWGG